MSSMRRWPRARNFAGDISDGATRLVSPLEFLVDFRGAALRGRALVLGTVTWAIESQKIITRRVILE
jgi:hypothetical protein